MGLKKLLLERGVFAGGIVRARLVKNYPGFSERIFGPEPDEFMPRHDQLRGTKALQEKVFSQPKIELVWNTVVHEIVGDRMLRSFHLRDVKIRQSADREVDAIFVALGLKPDSQVFSQLVTVDEAGFIVTDELMRSSVQAIFAAEGVRRTSGRQVITAAGDGAAAAGSDSNIFMSKQDV